jgi:hypothetical protein
MEKRVLVALDDDLTAHAGIHKVDRENIFAMAEPVERAGARIDRNGAH